MIIKISTLLLFCYGVSALHEAVVETVLEKVSEDMMKINTDVEDFNYEFGKYLGPVWIKFRIYLTNGKIIVTGAKLNSTVEYELEEPEGAANFKFNSNLVVFFAFRYNVYGGGALFSHGTLAGNWHGPLQISMDVEPTGCSVKLKNMARKTQTFDVDVTPNDNIFYPVTLHFPPGDLLEKHVESKLHDLLARSFNGKKLCDCVSCYDSK